MSADQKLPITENRIRLVTNGKVFRWRRDDGEFVSGAFETFEAALFQTETIPFLTNEEWTIHSSASSDGSEIKYEEF